MDKESLNYLLGYDMKIIQRKDMFNFSLDTVLLAHFCSITKNLNNIVDFGTNNAAIPLILSTRTDVDIIGVEIQEEAVDLARRNIEMNKLQDQVTIIHDDIKNYIKKGRHTKLVVCNPPFFKIDEHSHVNENEMLRIARHEVCISVEEIIECASKILEHKGRFAMVYRPDRLIDTITLFRKYDIEPKRLQFIYPKFGRECNTFLIEGIYKGNPGLRIEQPLYTHNNDGSYSDTVRKFFGE